jgi:sugar O-acyltransferase (sialic acid O-acetyltransferase NeuD family)
VADGERTFLVWGGGGHGKVVADLIRQSGGRVIGYIDREPRLEGEVVEPGGARVVMTEPAFLERAMSAAALPCGANAIALAIGDNHSRDACLDECLRFTAPALIHPGASVSASAVVGAMTVVFARAVINAEAQIGRAVIVNSGAIVEHDCVVGDAAHLSPGSILCGSVRVGKRTWVGAGAVVIQGIQVGSDARIGAGAVVIRDVPDGATVVGNPARRLGGGD